jgi:large subunit ribosomal protein L29
MATRVDYLKSISSLSKEQLEAKIKEDQNRLKKLEFAHAIKPIENPMLIRGLRKDIARLKTLLTAQ